MNRYDRLPGPVHVSHFIYHIFKDDIIKEKIDFDLKPLPYEIKKTVRTEAAADSALEDAVEISEPLVEEEAPIEEMLTNSEGQFEPIIEIDLDREKEEGPEPAAEPAPAAEPEPAAKKQPGYLGIEGLEPPEEDNTKKYLMWIIILIAIGIVAAIFIINYLSSAEDDPRAGLNMPVKQTAAPVQDKEKEATGPDGAAAVGSQEEGESESSETTGKKANVQAEQPAQKEYVRPTPPPREKEKESSRLARTDRKPKKDESPKPVIPVEEATREKQEEKKDSPAKVESSSEEKTGIVSEPEKQPAAVQPTAAAVVAGQIFPSTELDTQPVPISEPLPKLTPILRRTLSGNQTIIVSFLVDHKGSVEKVRIVNKAKNKKLNALIIDTIKTWTYRPAIKDNVRVKVWQTKTLRINK
jgi:TonB family protein